MSHERNLIRATILVTFILLTSAWRAYADPIAIPRSAFSGTERVASFNVSTDQFLPYSENGATFDYVPFGFVSSLRQQLNLQRPVAGGSGTLTVTFADPVSMAGFDFFSDFGQVSMMTAQVFRDVAGLQPLGAVDFGAFAPHQTAFIGFSDASVFARADITFTTPVAASWFIDDFRFGSTSAVPEPGVASLILLAAAVLRGRLRMS
jgi:hypothetical protein